MPSQARSELTLAAIVDTALDMAAAEGLESLTIGEVAKRLDLSKSGVFSRVGSREALQARRARGVRPPLRAGRLHAGDARGARPAAAEHADVALARAGARASRCAQGCIYCAGAFEYDDRHGPLRDQLLDGVRRWRAALKRTVMQAIDAGHLRARHRRRSAGVRDGRAVHRRDARRPLPRRRARARSRLDHLAAADRRPRAAAPRRSARQARPLTLPMTSRILRFA